ncbi:MAG: hypothetical protein LC808_29645 [Actinobacteria bacterium]|nr:hypothetical protein [Actinomycetota bacterium]
MWGARGWLRTFGGLGTVLRWWSSRLLGADGAARSLAGKTQGSGEVCPDFQGAEVILAEHPRRNRTRACLLSCRAASRGEVSRGVTRR